MGVPIKTQIFTIIRPKFYLLCSHNFCSALVIPTQTQGKGNCRKSYDIYIKFNLIIMSKDNVQIFAFSMDFDIGIFF